MAKAKANDTKKTAAARRAAVAALKREKPADLSEDLVNRLLDVQRGAQLLYAREAERLARKHGVDSPRAQRFIAAAEGAKNTLTALEAAEDARKEEAKQPDKPRKPSVRNVTFTVRGTVMTAEGKPAFGALVRVYDRDVKYDDLIGAALVSRKGEFSVTYTGRQFSEGEQAADLYFVVISPTEDELLSTKEKVIFNAERETTVELKIEAPPSPGKRG